MSEARVRKVMDALNRHDAAGFVSAYAANAVVYDPQYPEPLKGRDRIREDIDAFLTSFPDLKGSMGRVVEKDNVTAFEGSFTGTNKGPMKMPDGDLPPTNKTMNLHGAFFVKFNSEGEIEEERRYYDMAAMMTQLGMGQA